MTLEALHFANSVSRGACPARKRVRGTTSRAAQSPRLNGRRAHRAGFTLVEVLAAMIILGIVLPVAMRGVSLSLAAASNAKHTSEAAQLADQKLGELVITGQWQQSGMGGDFTPDHPDYHWTMQSEQRDYGLNEVRVRVPWMQRGQAREFIASTLVYDDGSGSTGTGGGLGLEGLQ
jgi:prepilin-type N-terminal cleavage/methylation domain-containing protein